MKLILILCIFTVFFSMLIGRNAVEVESQSNKDVTYQPNWSKMAEILIARLKLREGEKVLLHYDSSRTPEFIEALRVAIIKTGGIISAEIVRPNNDLVNYLTSLPKELQNKRQISEDASYRKLFADADVYLWIHSSNEYDSSMRWENLTAKSRVRAAHFHWFMPADAVEREQVMKMYEKALEIEPQKLNDFQDKLSSKLRGNKIHLTSPNGTDITFDIPITAHFHFNNGDAGADGKSLKTAKSVRDREQEFPSSGLRTIKVENMEGKFVGMPRNGKPTETVTLTFLKGRIVKIEAESEAGKAFVKQYEEAEGDRDKVGELVIGTNSELQKILPSGFKPYFGTGFGNINLRIGDNWESGGKNKVSKNWQGLLFVSDGNLFTNEKLLLENGLFKDIP